MSVYERQIEVLPGNPYPLGRHVKHDDKSWNYPAAVASTSREPSITDSFTWVHKSPVLDQGKVGSCTGHALVDCLMSYGMFHGVSRGHEDALKVYSLATAIDSIPGQYPPDDTGSTGLDVCRAALQLKWLEGYDHAFGIDHMLQSLLLSPVMVGSNWYSSMFYPDDHGVLSISGQVAGGHEYAVIGKRGDYLRILNSWGVGWGDHGRAWISVVDMARLLNEQGDVTVPRVQR